MYFSSARIITADIKRLIRFYEQVTGVSMTKYTDEFAELRTPLASLAIGSTHTLAPFGGSEVAEAASNRSVIIEFRVEDVDQLYEQLAGFLEHAIVQKPTTMPWGNRSLLCRDPDGNLVNFFTPVSADAKKRQEATV